MTNAIKVILKDKSSGEYLLPYIGESNVVENITYSELAGKKNNNELVPGNYYRITDYVTTTNGKSTNNSEPSRSAGHQFDIIIQALGTSDLAEIGTCALHEGDTYFTGQNLGAWQVWYDINNDSSKYAWADATNGTGVIYRMIDEYSNDLPYDFKNIQFYRDKTLSKYATLVERLTATDDYYYTFCDITNGATTGVTDFSLAINDNGNNSLKPVRGINAPNGVANLNNIVFLQLDGNRAVLGNTIGERSYNNTFGSFVGMNTITGNFYDNVVGDIFQYNNLGPSVYSNIIGANFLRNNVDSYFYSNNVGDGFDSNIMYAYVYNNTIGASCRYNVFESIVRNNTIGTGCQMNRIGYYSTDNEIGNNFKYNNIGNNFYNNKVSVNYQHNTTSPSVHHCNFGSYFVKNILQADIAYIDFPDGDATNQIFGLRYCVVKSGFKANQDTLLVIPEERRNKAYPQTIGFDSSGRPTISYTNMGVTKGIYKDSVLDSEWKELTTDYYTKTEINTTLGDLETLLEGV